LDSEVEQQRREDAKAENKAMLAISSESETCDLASEFKASTEFAICELFLGSFAFVVRV